MANSFKDIIITPNRANTADPKIEFRGGNTSVNTAITVQTYPTSNGTLSFEGSAGQLLSITNDLTGSIFSVNDVSGIPSIEVFADGRINLGQYGGDIVVGSLTRVSANGSFGANGQVLATTGSSVYWTNGTPGAQGAQGAQGAVGAQGSVGVQGAVGAQGSVGVQGAVGAQGSVGVQGATGTIGDVTTFPGDSTVKDDITTRTESGFYQSSTGTTAEGWPLNSGGWQHLLATTHSNDANYYSMQLAADFYSNSLFYRSTNGSGTAGWNRVALYDNNYGGTLYATLYYDNQNTAYYIDAANATISMAVAGNIVTGGSVRATTNNLAGLQVTASNTSSSGGSIAIQQYTTEGWTGIFCDYEPFAGYGIWADNGNDIIAITGESSTGGIRSFSVPSRVSGLRTAYAKFQVDQNSGDTIAGRDGYAYGSFRAPIFYDNNNTAYYLDAANATISMAVAGNVGIGTTSPQSRMHILDTAQGSRGSTLYLQNNGTSNGSETAIYMGYGAGETPPNAGNLRLRQVGEPTAIYGSDFYIEQRNGASSYATTFFIQRTTGNIGIGNTSPSNPLTIQNNTNQIRLNTSSDPAQYYATIGAQYNYGEAFAINVSGGAGPKKIFTYADGAGIILETGSASPISLRTNGTERVNIASTGGITNFNTYAVYVNNGRGVSLGYSGGNYGAIGYNVGFTGTSDSYTGIGGDTVSLLTLPSGGMVLYGAGSGAASRSLTLGTSLPQLFSVNVSGVAIAQSSFRAPTFYDRDTTAYYVTPASTGTALNVAGNAFARDFTASRGDGTGVIYLNGAQTRYLFFDGSTYNMPGAGLNIGGGFGSGAITSSGSVTASGAGGFASATYQNNVRNPIWRFGNADGYGLSYFQGTAGSGGGDSIGFHFGTATSAGSIVNIEPARLFVNGRIDGTIFYDYPNSAYYTDPASTSNLNGLRVVNGLTTVGSTSSASHATRYVNPAGGSSTTETSSITGAIKIRLPNLHSNAMFRMRVEVYNYSTGTPETFVISGYPYSASWANVAAEQYTDAITTAKNVRFGNDGTYNCVWIGELAQVWSYPQVFITEFNHGYAGYASDFSSGWNISFVTSFDTVQITRASALHWNTRNGAGTLWYSGSIPVDAWQNSTDGYNRFYFATNSHTYFKTRDAFIWRNSSDQDILNLTASGEVRATNNITAYYSDRRLKENIVPIENAVEKIMAISGVTFNSNEIAEKYGYIDKRRQVGVIAQEIAKVLPEVVVPAPFDIGQNRDGTEYSISGENYQTVQYEKIIPLLIEAMKEQQAHINRLEQQIFVIENGR